VAVEAMEDLLRSIAAPITQALAAIIRPLHDDVRTLLTAVSSPDTSSIDVCTASAGSGKAGGIGDSIGSVAQTPAQSPVQANLLSGGGRGGSGNKLHSHQQSPARPVFPRGSGGGASYNVCGGAASPDAAAAASWGGSGPGALGGWAATALKNLLTDWASDSIAVSNSGPASSNLISSTVADKTGGGGGVGIDKWVMASAARRRLAVQQQSDPNPSLPSAMAFTTNFKQASTDRAAASEVRQSRRVQTAATALVGKADIVTTTAEIDPESGKFRIRGCSPLAAGFLGENPAPRLMQVRPFAGSPVPSRHSKRELATNTSGSTGRPPAQQRTSASASATVASGSELRSGGVTTAIRGVRTQQRSASNAALAAQGRSRHSGPRGPGLQPPAILQQRDAGRAVSAKGAGLARADVLQKKAAEEM
jgi:hypothetical protein